MAQIGVMPGYVSAVNAYRARKAARPKTMSAALGAPAIGTTPATKAGLLPYTEGSLGLPGVPQVAAPKSIVPQLSIPKAPAVAPNTGLNEYTGEITSDPMYAIAQKNREDALAMGERSLFGDPFKQAVTQYGYVPSEAQIGGLSPDLQAMVRKYLDPTTVQAAQDNPFSVAKTISHDYGVAGAALPIDYAERGLMSAPGKLSGGAAIAQAKLDRARGQDTAQTMDEMLRGIGSANTNWLNFQNTQNETFRQAQEDIATRLSQDAGYHALLNAQGGEDQQAAAQNAAGFDYSGTPSALFQPDPQTGALMDRMQASGQYGAWAKAMSKPSAKTQKILKKVKGR